MIETVRPSRRQLLTFGILSIAELTTQAACRKQPASNELPAFPQLDINTLPEILPSTVQAQIDTVLAIRGQKAGGSGVKIAKDRILTARHLLPYDQEPEETPCPGMEIQGRRNISTTVQRIAAANSFSDFPSYAPDIILGEVHATKEFTALPDAQIASQLPRDLDHLFFINYQSDSSGKVRGPHDQNQAYAEPALLGGIVLKIDPLTGIFSVLTGVKDYSQGTPESYIRPAASGGAVMNTQGELVGLVFNTTNSPSNLPDDQFTPDDITRQYGIQLNGVKPGQLFVVAEIAPITKKLFADLESELKKLPSPKSCKK